MLQVQEAVLWLLRLVAVALCCAVTLVVVIHVAFIKYFQMKHQFLDSMLAMKRPAPDEQEGSHTKSVHSDLH